MRKDYSQEDEEALRRREIAEQKKRMTEKLILSVLQSKVALARLAGPIEKK